ncbi:MAG: FecR family protein [Deltaproteobacteria bacterium]|nr:FecR family protein [Deltaproteobacteria bacterium]
MSARCPRTEELLLPPALRTGSPEALAAHLEGCPDCQQAAGGLVSIRQELAEHAPVPRPGVEARILAELRVATALPASPRPSLSQRLVLGLGLAATAAVLALLLQVDARERAVVTEGSLATLGHPEAGLLSTDDPVPLATSLLTRGETRIATDLSRLSLAPKSELELRAAPGRRERDRYVREVRLRAGRVHAEVTPLREGRTFAVHTEEALVTVVGTAFSVERAEGRTVVEVEHGVVLAVSPDGRRRLELRAGDRAVFPPEEEAPPAPTLAPPPAPAEAAEAPGVDPDDLAELALRERARQRRPRRDRPAPVAAPAPPPAPVELSPPPTHVADPDRPREQRRQLAEARRVLRQAPSEAVDLARGVLDQAVSEEIEAAALAVMADGHRRAGQLEEAAATYARVAHHPAGEGLAEESLLQLAILRDRQRQAGAALAALEEAERRFPEGMLAPERVALSVELLGREGEPGAALEALLAAEGLHSPELERLRIRLAEERLASDPAAARRLLSATRLESLSPAWDARHQALLRRLAP